VAEIGSCPMCSRVAVVRLVEGGSSVVDAARRAAMSRKTAYKWLERYQAVGAVALEDRSRARHTVERFEGEVADELVELRRKHPTWGPRKLLQHFARKDPRRELPAASTVGALLKRLGLVEARVRVQSHVPFRYAGPTPSEANARWTMDFKGDFRTGDGTKCLPFTLRDAASRMVLSIRVMPSPSGPLVGAELEQRFREYGLPLELQSDGGPPFATSGLARLSALSVWLMKLGVCPVLSRPGKPQDNGGHERMHRDLKAETTRPPARTVRGQQRRFNAFRSCFNEERPHDALGGKVPAERWQPSMRTFPPKVSSWDYPGWWEERRVNAAAGTFSWKDQAIKCNDALGGEVIGFEPTQNEDGVWRIHFRSFVIGLFDERQTEPRVISLQREAGRLMRPS